MGNLKAVFLTALISFALGILLAFYLYGTQYQVVSSEGKAYKVNRMTGDAWLLAIGGQRKLGKGQPLCIDRFIVDRKKKQQTGAKPKITSKDQ
jgi:hypothetical protein